MNSKLGFHIQRRRQGWPNAVADALPAMVKSLEWRIIDDWVAEEQTDVQKKARAGKWQAYHVFLVGRHVTPIQPLDHPQACARAFWKGMLEEMTAGDHSKEAETLERLRLFDAWEGYNEIGTGPDIAKLGRFDAALAHCFHDNGLKYACGGFSVTNPTLEEWPRYYDALLEAAATQDGEMPDFLHLHEYWYPDRDWDSLLNAEGKIDRRRMRKATRGYMLHWRELYQEPNTPEEIKLPVIISECGWDRGAPQQVGFRASRRSDLDYLRWLFWYDQELQTPLDGKDYVVGAAIFTYGHANRWASFEIDRMEGHDILGPLRAYMRESNLLPHPRDWEELQEPEPEVQETHYLLLPQKSSLAWRHALDRYLDTFKVTNGQSLDDAVRLAAPEHHITLVGSADSERGVPQNWEKEIHRRNPDALVDRMEAHNVRELRRIATTRAKRGDRYGERE
ncbi:MAG: hypothetical protein U9R48_02315 [Chloroflexota bacterium]|nr:hypothetical protein [Chloroflexota bacterium]